MGSVKSAMFVGGSERLPRFGNIRQKMGDWTEQRSSAGRERLRPTTTSIQRDTGTGKQGKCRSKIDFASFKTSSPLLTKSHKNHPVT